MPYVTPLQDFRFTLSALAGLDDILKLPGFEEVTPDLVDAILDENARFVEQAIVPLNVPGDTQPPRWDDGPVTTKIGRAPVCTPVTNAHLGCRLLLEKKNTP